VVFHVVEKMCDDAGDGDVKPEPGHLDLPAPADSESANAIAVAAASGRPPGAAGSPRPSAIGASWISVQSPLPNEPRIQWQTRPGGAGLRPASV
jgi:hypothetical protein